MSIKHSHNTNMTLQELQFSRHEGNRSASEQQSVSYVAPCSLLHFQSPAHSSYSPLSLSLFSSRCRVCGKTPRTEDSRKSNESEENFLRCSFAPSTESVPTVVKSPYSLRTPVINRKIPSFPSLTEIIKRV